MRLEWLSTAPWGPSSYSVLTKRTVPDLVRMGHQVYVATWYGLQGEPQQWEIRHRREHSIAGTALVLPSLDTNSYGVHTLLPTYQTFGCQALIACMDAWVLPPALTMQTRFAPWLPVDHDPVPQGVVQAVAHAIYPMVYSQWGTDVLSAAGVPAHYVPCSADANVYKPIDKADARKAMHLPEDMEFMVAMVAANKDPGDRKGLSEALQGFALFRQSHPNAYMYLHTVWTGPVNIDHIAASLGISDHVMRPEPLRLVYGMFPDDYMQKVYSAADVLLNPAKSEGFGLPIIEAELCGCPVAATDFSTSKELGVRWLIPGQRHWSIGADSWRLLVSPEGVADALEAAFAEKDNQKLRDETRAKALPYNTERVAKEYWVPAMQEIEKLACGAKLVTF